MTFGSTFEERLGERDLTIITPDDEEYIFTGWTDFEITREKKISEYKFGDTTKQLLQDFGLGKVSIPLTIYITGIHYDKDADRFDKSLQARGRCELFHPVYGRFDCIISPWTRKDALVSGRGQAVFNLTVTETIIPERPETGQETRALTLNDIEELATLQVGVFEQSFLAELVSDIIAAKNRITSFVSSVRSAFQSVLNTVADIQSTFDNLEKSILNNIDFFLSAPALLATNLQRLIASPARLANNVKKRVDIYRDLYNNLLNPVSGTGQNAKNQAAEKQLQSVAILSAISESNLFPENIPDDTADTNEILGFLTQNDAINAATDLANDYFAIQTFLDELQQSSEGDTLEYRFEVSDEIAKLIKKITSETAKNLVRLSFSLKTEKIIEVQSDTNLINLCFDLYGTTSNSQIDFLIQTNGLTGEDLLTIKKGTLIKSYA